MNKKRCLDKVIGHYTSKGTANGRDLYLGSKDGIYFLSDNNSKTYVKHGINFNDSLDIDDRSRINIDTEDPVVGRYNSKGCANGREVRKGKRGAYYYLSAGSKRYLSNNLESISFITPEI